MIISYVACDQENKIPDLMGGGYYQIPIPNHKKNYREIYQCALHDCTAKVVFYSCCHSVVVGYDQRGELRPLK